MEVVHYPLLCWEIAKDYNCAHLIGSSHEVVSKSLKKIKTILEEQILREAESDLESCRPRIQEATLKIVPVEVRPAYKEKDGFYPQEKALELKVAAVYGENEYGFYECFLPLLAEHFFFYDVSQAIRLIEHFAQDCFQGAPPENIHRFLTQSPPWLEDLVVRLPEKVREKDWRASLPVEVLPTVAERHPAARSLRQKVKTMPEAAWEQGELVQRVVNKLWQERANLLLVGPHGVGKSAVLLEAIGRVHQLSRHEEETWPRYFWKTSPHKWLAGTKYLGEWEEICENSLRELADTGGVLWLVDFVAMVTTGGEGAEDSLAAFLMSYLETSKIQIVSEVTPQELDAAHHLLPGFVEQFQTLVIAEMPEKKVCKVLEHFASFAQEKFNVALDNKALELSYRLLRRFIKYESFPGKAITFLGQCVSEAQIKNKSRLGEMDIRQAFAQKTGLAELFLRDDMLLDPVVLHDYFVRRIIGQEEAAAKVASVVNIFKAGLNNPAKPIATMIFAGPTGVGKTAMARALSDYFFSSGQQKTPLIRLDMSEFQHPYQITRLIGGGHEPGKLIQEVRERPFSILLLDEIEKAHSSIFDALLTVLDEGILLDAAGRITDFRNTVIIMTSNLGAGSGRSLGFAGEKTPDFGSAIHKFFRPEFYNRLDMVVTFRSLTPDMITEITRKELRDLSEREGFVKRGLRLKYSDELVQFLAAQGFDEKYGARPLQRAIERLVVAAVAQFLLAYAEVRDCCLILSVENGAVQVKRA
jgi:ATP-dependent Clp protease ATP-binding subunit ClpA